MNQSQLFAKIRIISKLSEKIRLIWIEHGLSKKEVDSKMVHIVISFLPNEQRQNLKNLKVEEVINKILSRDKNNVSLTLTKIVAVLDAELGQLKMNEEEEYAKEEKQQFTPQKGQSSQKKKWQYLPKQLMKSMKRQFEVKLQTKQKDEDYLPMDLSENSDSEVEFEKKTNNFEKSLKDTLARTRMLRAYLEYQLKDDSLNSKTSPLSRLRQDFLSSC